MLTEEQIENNKIEFLKLISEIDIEGADTQGLVEFLDENDFFNAPASTLYHANFKGGLCYHSLNVYKELLNLYNAYRERELVPEYDKNSLLVIGLLHDISKVNYYESYVVNKKIYNEKGTKHDNLGKFDWFAEEAFKVKDAHDRTLLGSHEEASSILIGKYIPMNLEELLAVMHHQAIPSEGQPIRDMSAMLNKYPLITLIQMADYISTFILERI